MQCIFQCLIWDKGKAVLPIKSDTYSDPVASDNGNTKSLCKKVREDGWRMKSIYPYINWNVLWASETSWRLLMDVLISVALNSWSASARRISSDWSTCYGRATKIVPRKGRPAKLNSCKGDYVCFENSQNVAEALNHPGIFHLRTRKPCALVQYIFV